MQPDISSPKISFLHNDRALVCSMFIFYGLCILGLIGATFWALDRRSKEISKNATSTAAVVATEQAVATTTAVARRTEQDRYQVVDRFDSNKNSWRSGSEYSNYWNGRTDISDGIYLWDVQKTKDTFIAWADYSGNDEIKDFDVYVETKAVEAGYGDVCSGLIFRKSPYGWDEGGYYFVLCNNSSVHISYHEKDNWESLAILRHPVDFSGWNRLEISARGSHFAFLINGTQVHELEDDRQKIGGLALVIELNEIVTAKVAFDNFGLQER